MAEYNSFTYDEIKSSDFGVYIGGEKTFDAPSLRGQSIEIPGRNGNVFISSDSYENVELVYPSFNFEPDLETFRSKLAKLRNALSSRASYKRLTDTLHPDEFRMAVFRDGFEVKPIKYNTAAEFDIVFDCKPQRFLKSGEIPVEYTPGQTPSDEQTKTGSIVTFEAEEGTIISDVKADINPVQDLHGYDKPWAGGNGKNKLPMNVTSQTVNGVTFTVNDDGSISTSGTATANTGFQLFIGTNNTFDIPNGEYILTGCPSGGGSTYQMYVDNRTADGTGSISSSSDTGSGANITITQGKGRVYIYILNGQNMNGKVFYPMLRLASVTDATFEPYENICPISGWDRVKIANMSDITNRQYFNGLLDGTYGFVDLGTLNYSYQSASGVFVVQLSTKKNGQQNILCSKYINSPSGSSVEMPDKTVKGNANNNYINFKDASYNGDTSAFKTAMSGVYLVYELATPTTPTITKAQFDMLLEAFGIGGQLYIVDLNGTRYGCTLDVTSGVLVVDRKIYRAGDLSQWDYATGVKCFAGWLPTETASITQQGTPNCISSVYKHHYPLASISDMRSGDFAVNTSQMSNNNKRLVVKDDRYTSVSDFLADNADATFVIPLATPITVQLTPTEVKALLGVNNVWADSGDITVKYGTNPYIIVNPTDFPSKPLLEVTGVGSFWLGDTQITITGTSGQTVYIDCETGECYKVTGGIISPANGLVTLNRLDFPKLASGINNIQLGSGISKVKITPRWWRL